MMIKLNTKLVNRVTLPLILYYSQLIIDDFQNFTYEKKFSKAIRLQSKVWMQ